MTRSIDVRRRPAEPISEIDVRAIAAAIRRRRLAILVPTGLAFLLITIYVNVATPKYTSAAQVLLENQETFFTRPDRVNLPLEQITQVDPEAVASQIQLIGSRDLARRAVKQLGLRGNPEFDPEAKGSNPFTRVLVLLGILPSPTSETVEARTVTAFLDRLTVLSPSKTRVITIEFTSRDPELAARGANTVAELYLQEQSAAKRSTAKSAADALAAQIADLRIKLAGADAERERYRLQSGLLAGTNNMTISGQQLADINTDLSRARSAQADAQAKASLIREFLRDGKSADVTEVINNDIVRRISDQRVVAQAQLALESRTLLSGHPRIKELTAQVAQYDFALKTAARQAAISLENEAKIAGQRVANLEAVMKQQKQTAGAANTDEIKLHALERAAQSYKDQLDSSTTKYQEALARQSSAATPADARIISSAVRSQDPSFPKKLPFIIFGTVATFVFALGYVVASELLSGRAVVEGEAARDGETVGQPVEHDVRPEVARPEVARPEVAPVAAPLPAREPPVRAPEVIPAAAFAVSDADQPARARKTGALRFNIASRFARGSAEDRLEPVDLAFAPLAPTKPVAEMPAQPETKPTMRRSIVAGSLLGGVMSYLKTFGQSAAASESASRAAPVTPVGEGVGWDAGSPVSSRIGDTSPVAGAAPTTPDGPLAGHDQRTGAGAESVPGETSWLTARIVAAHVPGRGLHVVGTSLGSSDATNILIDLSRQLSEKGRSIIVDLNRTPMTLASLAAEGRNGRETVAKMHGLSELLAGEASFAEVIHRDHASRLHFIPTGLQEADFRDFDLILDALSETYDFVMLLTPAFPQSEIAKVMAPYAEFVVLTAATDPNDATLSALENELIEAGAQEVLVAGIAARDEAKDVA